ncbi:MAG: hypothetical protein WCP65_02905 [Bacteroidota bacterium]
MGIQENKIDKMYDMLVDLTGKQREMHVYLEQNRKELDAHREELDILNEHKNNWIGKASILSSAVGAFVTGFIMWFTKHI